MPRNYRKLNILQLICILVTQLVTQEIGASTITKGLCNTYRYTCLYIGMYTYIYIGMYTYIYI